MMELSEEQRRNLEEDWGTAATKAEFSIGDTLRYKADGNVWNGTILWCAAPSPSTIEGHGMLPLRYIVARFGWSEDSIPDVVYSKDVIQS